MHCLRGYHALITWLIMHRSRTCQVRQDEETGQTILSGMGELHLEILVDRLKREFKCAANVGKPMVSYLETVTAPAASSFTFDRELGGKRHAVTLTVEVKPLERGKGREVKVARDVLNELPDPKLSACLEQALMDGVMTGVLARYPMTDLSAAVTGMELVDPEVSDEIALRGAAMMGFREAAEAAAPEFLEPIMKLDPGSKYRSSSGLSPREHLERQAEFHASTQDEA